MAFLDIQDLTALGTDAVVWMVSKFDVRSSDLSRFDTEDGAPLPDAAAAAVSTLA